MAGSGAVHDQPRVSHVRRASALAMMLALAGTGCQTGARSPGPGGGVSTPLPTRTVPVPAPTGGGTYAVYCAGTPNCPSGGVPAMLRRRMRLPHLAARIRCPVSAPGRNVSRWTGVAIGPGPIYALSYGPFGRTAILPFVLPSRAVLFGGSAWGGQVLKWLGAPSYHGPVLIRGRKLTGRDGLGFNAGVVPQAEMDLPPDGVLYNSGGWRQWPGYVRLRSPGCYGLQVDGTTFSEVIIFRACLSSNPVRQTFRCRSP